MFKSGNKFDNSTIFYCYQIKLYFHFLHHIDLLLNIFAKL